MGSKTKTRSFKTCEDGWLKWETAGLIFLIGDTAEIDPHIGLWISSTDVLNYKMVDRGDGCIENIGETVDRLKKEAKVLLVRSRVMGMLSFLDFIKEKQVDLDIEMWWSGHESEVNKIMAN